MWLIAVAIILFISVVPVMVGARVVGARRNGFWVCLGALLLAVLISWFDMLVLDTNYLRGLAIAVIHMVLVGVLIFVLMVTAIGSMFHMKDMLRHIPIDTAPTQSV
jgi:hypothetical protein